MRILLITLLSVVGLTPTVVTGLIVAAMAGKPAVCNHPNCHKTYGLELLVLPASTLAPFISGILLAKLAQNKQQSKVQRQPIAAVRKGVGDERTA